MKNKHLLLKMTALAVVTVSFSWAQNTKQLTRDQVSVIKKKLVAVLNALGDAPKGYRSDEKNESFNLPTEYYESEGSANLLYAGAHREYSFKTDEDEQKAMMDKIKAAQAKGDIQEVVRLSQEMQSTAMKAASSAETNPPIRIDVYFNRGENETIDPDGVLAEGTGFIALKSKQGENEGNERIRIFFDPVSLKDTKTLSKVDFNQGESVGSKKPSATTVKYVTVEFVGPEAAVETWAKKVSTKTILAQVD
ncbi:MAG: hypothetical protein HYY49_08835 [Ignavibacteriales bacterium]|nr:hypothetical protein [Ignavibacteriales bacterium]